MDNKVLMEKVTEIEEHMIEVRNLFVQIFNRMVKGSRRISDMPVTLSQMKALTAFHEDREYTMTELSKNALVKMPSMTEMVDRLEAEGVLQRMRDTKDRRVVNVALTDMGKKIHSQFIGRRRDEMGNLFGKLTVKDQDELLVSLRRVSGVLKKITKS
ncbi:MAG: MarR family transcriptional regulator [Proteobacteria bacterium]|nr:MarR family transcriptional regulator [Pseudomonadota bacterium]